MAIRTASVKEVLTIQILQYYTRYKGPIASGTSTTRMRHLETSSLRPCSCIVASLFDALENWLSLRVGSKINAPLTGECRDALAQTRQIIERLAVHRETKWLEEIGFGFEEVWILRWLHDLDCNHRSFCGEDFLENLSSLQ